MAKVRDRTEDFKDAVRHTALSLGYDESKLAAILANFVIHKPRQRSPFTKAALKTLESIGTLEQFMVKHRKDYVDLHRTTEQERDSIEHEILMVEEYLLEIRFVVEAITVVIHRHQKFSKLLHQQMHLWDEIELKISLRCLLVDQEEVE